MAGSQKIPSDNGLGGAGLAIGVAIGVALGVAMDNIGAGIGIGIAIGIALGFAMRGNADKGDRDTGEPDR